MEANTSVQDFGKDRFVEGSATFSCPLCRASHPALLARAHKRDFFACEGCRLVFLAPEHRPDRQAEREHYGTHRNAVSDPAYRAFLSRLDDPLIPHLAAGAAGLDYGSGPAPALARMLEERGFRMTCFDAFFARDREALLRSYDFIVCSETAEHFFHPGEEFALLDCLLRPGGCLALMTEVLRDDQPFETWRYARDPTHVSFYRPETFAWIGRAFGWTPFYPHRNVVIFRKPAPGVSRFQE